MVTRQQDREKVPDGWKTARLGDFAPFTYGKGLRQKDRDSSGAIPVLGSNGVVGYHHTAWTDGPTIVVGRKGTVGAVHYSPEPCWPIDTTFYVTGDCLTDDDDLVIKFKYYMLKSLGLENMNSDSAVPGLNRNNAHSLEILLPPAHEQRAIAEVLECIDASIESAEAVVAANEQVRDSLLNELLTRGMPGWHTEWREVPGIGTVPASWDVVRLGDVAEVVGGSTPARNRPEYWDGEIPWVVPSELTGLTSRYLTATNEAISLEGMKTAGLRLLPVDSVLVTSRATIGVTAMNQFPLTTNQGFKSLIAKPGTDPCWLYYMISSRRSELERKATGSTFGEVGARTFRQLFVASPPLNEQRAICDLLETVDLAIANERSGIASLHELKTSTADALMSGRVRTKEKETEQ